MVVEADFSGYATKANLKCSDGRTIAPDAFKHQDKMKVPLVWQHTHNDLDNVLGHVILENRPDGVYCNGYFNESDAGKKAKIAVEHGDLNSLSIYANRLKESLKTVTHGIIREVSLVLAGANPEALIDFVNIRHGDGTYSELEDEAVIYLGEPFEIQHKDEEAPAEEENTVADEVTHADEKTVADVLKTLNEEQLTVVYYMVGEAAKGKTAKHSDADVPPNLQEVMHSLTEEQDVAVRFLIGDILEHTSADSTEDAETTDSAAHADNEEGITTMTNVFESNATAEGKVSTGTKLSHSEQEAIFKQLAKQGGMLSSAIEGHALAHGIEDIDVLFPDARNVTATPDFIKRRTEWVASVLSNTKHSPFSRIKSMAANLTLDEARAKGYVKGNLKKEEFFRVSKRVTTPQTVYKKQQLDRDDILDITDFDVVAWLKGEMRLMLEEEIARAILIGDGRSGGDEDKIKEDNVRPIATDSDLYVTYLNVDLGDDIDDTEGVIDSIILNRQYYRGTGTPTLYCGESLISRMLSIKDADRRRIYPTTNDLLAVLRVSAIVPVEVMDSPSSPALAIMVNLTDYTVGADKGGDVALFDDFDIDYNQYKYLIETRISGALTKPKSALVIKKVQLGAALVNPEAPAWDNDLKTVTVATTTGITYRNKETNGVLTTGAPVTLAEGDELTVIATPASSSYFLASNAQDEFLFDYDNGQVAEPF